MRMLCGMLAVLCLSLFAGAQEDKPLSVEQAVKLVNKDATVEFVVMNTGKTKAGDKIFLNSEADFKSEKNFTVVLEKAVIAQMKAAKIDDPTTHFKGKKIQVYGTIKLYKDRPEMVLIKFEQLKEAK